MKAVAAPVGLTVNVKLPHLNWCCSHQASNWIHVPHG